MAEAIAGHIRGLRVAGGLSLRELARRSGVSQPTLTRWEQGRNLPRLPELEAVLRALGVGVAQLPQATALLDAPRARLSQRGDAQQEAMGALPGGGDLLRAMRLRRGLTLEAVAAGIGVQVSTLSRWERGEMWPQTDRLHALCYLLGAIRDEIAALTAGRFAFTPEREDAISLDELRSQLETLRRAEVPLRDLGLLALEARLWGLAKEHFEASCLLMQVFSTHALYLSDQKRYAEAMPYVERSLQMASMQRPHENIWLPAVIAGARIETYSAKRRFPERGIARLRAWLPRVASVSFRAWMFSDIAEYLALDGSFEDALTLGKQSLRLVQVMAWGDTEELFRRRDLASLLVRAGRPHEALETLSDCAFDGMGPEFVIRDLLLRSEAFLACRDSASAGVCLTEAENSIVLHHLEYLRPQVAALAQRL